MEMNVIISCLSESWGGLEIMAMEHIKQLKKHKIRSSLLCYNDSKLHKNSQNADIENLLLIFKSGKISVINKLINQLKNITVIHSHLSHDLGYLVPALRLCGSPAKLFLTKHIASGINKNDILHRYLYNRVDGIFAISEFIRQNVLKTCPVEENIVKIMPNGIDLREYNKQKSSMSLFRDEFGIGSDKIVIALIGRITPGKGHTELIEAAGIINKQHGGRVIYVVAGSPSKGEEHLEAKVKNSAKERGINNIIFTGFRSDVKNILASADILAFPSHEESFGITLLEAMAMEVPVVASNNAGITDIIPSEEYGILVTPKDAESLALGIIKLIENPELRKVLSVNGHKRVEEKFNIVNITKELIKYYNN